MIDNQPIGTGFTSLEFKIVEDGTTKVDDTFTSLSTAQTFFKNDAIDLGTITSAPNQLLNVNFDLITSASNSGFGENFLIGTQGGNQPPITTVPGPQNIQQAQSTPISGISVVDGDASSANETITVVLSDTNGLLTVGGAGVTGSGTNHVTIAGSLSQVNSDLSTLTFKDNVAGPESIDVATSDGRGGSDDHQIAVNVFSPLTSQEVLTSATEHVALPGSTTVATFTDSDTSDLASGFTATINWGDGNNTAGTVTGSNGSFSVAGGHTYAEEGNFGPSVLITRTSDGVNTTANGTVSVAEHDALTPQGTTINAATNQPLNNVVVATFSDSDTASSANDFFTSIDWGDGTTTGGSVSGSAGSFTVTGSHTYTAPGTDNMHVTLTDDGAGTASATANSTANVTGGVLASQEVLTSATEHVALPGSTTVATFTDSNANDLASGFTASINWGDGNVTTGTVTGSNGSFSVDGGHTYLDETSAPVSVSINRTSDNGNTTATGTVSVAEHDALTPQGTTFGATTNQALNNVVVATFSDADTTSPAGDFFASINWGDGTTTGGSVSGSAGAFTVTGSHTYTAPGTDNMHVTLTDDAPGTATATANSTVNVTGGTLASQEVLTSATEHVALPGSTTVATFTDSDTTDLASGFTASINWGDSTVTTGTVTGSNGSFSVAGGHTYTDEGSAPLSVSITRSSDNGNTTANGTVSVAEHDALTPQGTTIAATTNNALNNVTVATFSDTDTANTAGDFTASINWGDGTTTGGSVSGSSGAFTVTGSHTYTTPGTDNMHVTLSDDAPGTATATANSTVNVVGGALASQEVLTSATEHVALPGSTTVATFTDSDTTDQASGFAATINWGDGSATTTGTVTGSNGSFSVAGGHTYLDEASAPVSVSITRGSDNGNTTANGPVSVAEHDALTPQGTTIGATTNEALNNVTVATFSDTDTASPAGDFSASINWGDGTTTGGSVSGSAGAFTVTGSHTYTAPGTDNVHVTLSDDAPGTATATANSTANVVTGSLSGQEVLTSATEHVALADSTTVATLTDTYSSVPARGFSASIDWGDGTAATTGTVTGSNGSFSVDGGHTYTDEASAPVSVLITRTSDNANTTANGTVTVGENDALTPQGTTINTFTNQPLNNVVVATFSDTDTASPASDLPASITWGDGTTTTGSVSGSGGSFTVTGSHTYTAPGTDNVHVTLSDDAPGTASATANSTVNVSAGTLASAEVLTSATEHVALPGSTTVATFTDTNPTDQASGFTATIDWGDGITATGTVAGSNGSFSVDGGHTYNDEASAPVSVLITRTSDSANTTANGQVSVA